MNLILKIIQKVLGEMIAFTDFYLFDNISAITRLEFYCKFEILTIIISTISIIVTYIGINNLPFVGQ